LVLTSIVMWACLLPAQLRQGEDNPYIGLATMGIGCILILGVIITPLGLHLGRRRLEKQLASALADGRTRWGVFVVFLAVTSGLNLLIASQTTLHAVHFMEQRQFCGSCHVMTPESRAFDQGPHAGILCVDCHVGEGTRGYVQSKIQGTHQLISVLTDSVEKPIKGAIEAGLMVPSKDTCEGCHWKDQPANATLKMIRRYEEDEANTPKTTLLTMNVGGARMGGIHGVHFGEGVRIDFVAADPKRQEIPLVEYKNTKTGVDRTFVKTGSDAAKFAGQPRVEMQCFDCHSRPAHSFQLADQAVDRAITLGRMSSSLPFLKKTAVELLKAEYKTSDAAAAEIPKGLASYYEKNYPDVFKTRASDVQAAGSVLADVYSRNVFPELGVTWGTYIDNSGHRSSPGCFRCHDDEHATTSGDKITKNCFRCHFPSSVDDAQPEMLELLGLDRMLHDLKSK
jgi:nitrate/TMAO reductase-like tetraheme cytochrome c subunit